MTRKKEQEQFISYITERQTHEGQMAVADFLRKYAVRYHNSDLFPLIRCSFRIVIILRRILKSVLFLLLFLVSEPALRY